MKGAGSDYGLGKRLASLLVKMSEMGLAFELA